MAFALVKFRFEGMQDYLQKLKSLSPRNRKAVLTTVVRRASQVVRRQMLSALSGHERSGILRRSIKVKLKHYSNTGAVVAMIGVASDQDGSKPSKSGKPGKVVGRGFNQFGSLQIAMKYGRLVDKGRRAFTQRFETKIGKRYYVKGHRGLWKATRVIPMTRNIGAAAPVNFVEKSAVGVQDRMRAAMIRALDTWLEKRGY